MVTNEQIVRAWFAEGKTTQEVAKGLGLSVGSLSSRVKKMRAAGVNLPKKTTLAARIDVAGLNALIESITKPSKVTPPANGASHQPGAPESQIQRTQRLAQILSERGPQHISALAKASGLSVAGVEVLTKQKYFERDRDKISLTVFAQSELLGKE